MQPLFLVIVQLSVDKREGNNKSDDQGDPDFPIHPDNKQNPETEQCQYRSGTQIGLFGDQTKRQTDVKREFEKIKYCLIKMKF